MAPRAIWKGHLEIGQLVCPVALHAAASTSERVAFHIVNRKTGHRVRRVFVDAETGEPVERDDQAKGYETDRGKTVVVEEEELAEAVPESDKTPRGSPRRPLRRPCRRVSGSAAGRANPTNVLPGHEALDVDRARTLEPHRLELLVLENHEAVALDLVALGPFSPTGLPVSELTYRLSTRLPVSRLTVWNRRVSPAVRAGSIVTGQVTSDSLR